MAKSAALLLEHDEPGLALLVTEHIEELRAQEIGIDHLPEHDGRDARREGE